MIDDGSEEDIAGVCAAAGIPVRCIRMRHTGAAGARNAGIAAAAGELLAFLDSDDEWEPEHLARCVPILRDRPEVGLVHHPFQEIDGDGRPLPDRAAVRVPSGRVTRELFAHDFVITPSVVCRRELVRAIGGFDAGLQTGEDYDLFLRLSRTCDFVGLAEPLGKRRRHAGNTSKQQRVATAVRHAELRQRFWQRNPDLRDAWGRGGRRVLAKAFYRAGRLLWRGGWARSARRYLRQSLRYRPFYPRAMFWLGVAAFAGGRGEPAGDPGGSSAF